MITLLMLPFLLAIRTSVNDNGRFHVPVYTYTAQVSINSVNQETGLKAKAFEMSSGLKCHPRVPDILNCRFDNTEMRFYQQGLADLGEDSIAAWDMSEEPFEVRFDRKGVRDLTVDRSMPPWVIGGIRAIINQLNFGLDARLRHDGSFATTERSYLGECETLVRITRRPVENGVDLSNDNAFEITSMPGFKKEAGEVLEIEKQRNLDECSDDIDPLFGRMGASSTVYGNIPTKMVSSVSHIVISDTNYTSSTANEILATSLNTAENLRLYEKITLKLVSVATGSYAHPPPEQSVSTNV